MMCITATFLARLCLVLGFLPCKEFRDAIAMLGLVWTWQLVGHLCKIGQ